MHPSGSNERMCRRTHQIVFRGIYMCTKSVDFGADNPIFFVFYSITSEGFLVATLSLKEFYGRILLKRSVENQSKEKLFHSCAKLLIYVLLVWISFEVELFHMFGVELF